MYQRIKALANEKGMSIRKLEIAAGLSNGSIRKWNGKRGPSATNLKPVADVLGVTIDELIKEED